MSGDSLAGILADKRARLDRGEYDPGRAPGASDGSAFVSALRGPGVRIVAEIKRRSPSAGEILFDADGRIETLALAYRRGHAAAISVVTEEDHFGGRADWISRAKHMSGLPVLMKDFLLTERQLDFAVRAGADAVLLIVRILSDEELARLAGAAKERGLATVVEAHSADEVRRAAAAAPDVLGVNARDLSTLATDLNELETLVTAMPSGPVKLAESGIRSRDEIARLSAAGYEAFLIGETLLKAADPEEMLRELRR